MHDSIQLTVLLYRQSVFSRYQCGYVIE